jgi:hypothetical protein
MYCLVLFLCHMASQVGICFHVFPRFRICLWINIGASTFFIYKSMTFAFIMIIYQVSNFWLRVCYVREQCDYLKFVILHISEMFQ